MSATSLSNDQTRAQVLAGLDSAIARAGQPGCPKDWRLGGALAYLQGWLKKDEPEIAAKLGQLIEAAEA